MEIVTLVRRICLHSQYLDKDLQHHLLQELIKTTRNECGKEYGHLISVKKINKIMNHKIGRVNGDNVFTVEFDVLVLHPIVDTELPGVVCMVYQDGIFVNILEKQKMLIPATSLKMYKFNGELSIYESHAHSIGVGDDVEVVVTASQYSDGCFSCLGILKEL